MESPPWRPILKYLRRVWLRISHDQHYIPAITGVCAGLAILLITFFTYTSTPSTSIQISPSSIRAESRHTLFIAIGTAPQNIHLRKTARQTWLSWLPPDATVAYRFFTDSPPSIKQTSNASTWRALRQEVVNHDDIILQPLPGGYGTKEHNAYGQRALYQLHWATKNAPSDYFLRLDDDSFLCLHRILYELRTAPTEQFFWGRFWCREGRNRADENFMLFSRDVVELLTNDQLVGKILPFDRQVTLGWNFGYWSWVLNLTIFDDQRRIDAQQGYLTKYMHATDEPVEPFCEQHVCAHHVTPEAMIAAFAKTAKHVMYSVPDRTPPTETCRESERSFVPGRHSSALPAVKITRAVGAKA